MEEKKLSEEREPYIPRPWYQVAGAWIGLVLFLISAVLLFLYVLRLY